MMKHLGKSGLALFAIVVSAAQAFAQTRNAQVAHEQICRATIAALMGREPETIEIAKVEAGVVHLGYVRQSDGTRWKQRCRVKGDKVIWATETGRWRTHPDDGVVSFKIIGDTSEIEIAEQHFDGSRSVHKFKISRLR